MYNINTGFWKKKSLSQYVLNEDSTLTFFALFTLGIIAAVLHLHLRIKGLNIPGHHGVELMMVLLFGRMQSRYQWAGVMIASGAAITYCMHAASVPMVFSVKPAIIYLLNAFCLDLLFRYTPSSLPVFLKGVIFGGLSYIIKPVMRIPVAMYLGAEFGSIMKYGYLIPVLTHFVFGSIGAICGIALANLVRNNKKR